MVCILTFLNRGALIISALKGVEKGIDLARAVVSDILMGSMCYPIPTVEGLLPGGPILGGLCWERLGWWGLRLCPPHVEGLRVCSLAEEHSGVHFLHEAPSRGFEVCSCSLNQAVRQE